MHKDDPSKERFCHRRKANPFKRGLAVFIAVAMLPASLAILSGCETNTGIEPWQATAEELEIAGSVAGRNPLIVGCWIPPRPHQMTTEEEADQRMKAVMESGINMVSTHHNDLADMDFIHRLIKSSAKYGIDVIIELNGDLSDNGIQFNLGVVRETMDYENIIGYNLFDEPLEGHREGLVKEYGLVKELVPDKIVMINLLPNYGPLDAMAPTVSKGLTTYQTYVDNFAEISDVLSFDFYPYQAGGEQIAFGSFLSNCSDFVLASRKYDRPIWGFLQCCSWSGMLLPEEGGLRLIAHAHLLFQVKTYQYFLYAQPDEPGPDSYFNGMVRWNGKKTETYYRVQKTNEEIANFGNRVLSYDLSGIYTEKLTKEHKDRVDKSLRVSRGSKFKSIESDYDYEFIAGVFKPRSDEANVKDGYVNDIADEAVYVINFSRMNRSSVTVKFNGVQEYTVWGPDGIESMGAASEVNLYLLEGDARFIEFKTFKD